MTMLLVKLPEPSKPTQKPTYMPPIGLWSIQHNAPRNHRIKVLDLHLSGGMDLLKTELVKGWDCVGISAQFSIQHDLYAEAAKMAHESGSYVVAGGFHASAVPPPKGVASVIHGHGEYFLRNMAFCQIEYPPIDVDKMRPYWDIGVPHDLQSKTSRWMPMEFSRGCNRHCGYCGVNGFWGGVQYYSRAKISDRLDEMVANGIRETFIEDDNCISDSNMFAWIVDQLGNRGIAWSTPNGISARALATFVPELAKNGCWRVSLPFETGVESTAKLMRLGTKWMPFDKAKALVYSLKAEGILTCGFFIIGYPGETLADIQATLDYANALPLDQRNIYIATPYPGTPIYDECVKKGYLSSSGEVLYRDLLYTKGMITTPEFTPSQVEALKAKDRESAITRRSKNET